MEIQAVGILPAGGCGSDEMTVLYGSAVSEPNSKPMTDCSGDAIVFSGYGNSMTTIIPTVIPPPPLPYDGAFLALPYLPPPSSQSLGYDVFSGNDVAFGQNYDKILLDNTTTVSSDYLAETNNAGDLLSFYTSDAPPGAFDGADASPDRDPADAYRKQRKYTVKSPNSKANRKRKSARPTSDDEIPMSHYGIAHESSSADTVILPVDVSTKEPAATVPASICRLCKVPILAERQLLCVDERAFHAACLKCGACDAPLADAPTCYVKFEQLYCKLCYGRKFQNKCTSCDRRIHATDWVRRARDSLYHLACFACEHCKRQLSTGEQFSLQDGRLLCKQHYLELVEGEDSNVKQKAKRVRTTFAEEQLSILQAHFHVDCNPDGSDLERIANLTGLSKRVTQVWFQNSRARQKKHQIGKKLDDCVSTASAGGGLPADSSSGRSSSAFTTGSGDGAAPLSRADSRADSRAGEPSTGGSGTEPELMMLFPRSATASFSCSEDSMSACDGTPLA